MAANDPESRYRAADLRLRALLLGDGTYDPGIAKGEDSRARVSRELRHMHEAFDELVADQTRRAEAEARVADLEEELRRIASAPSPNASSLATRQFGTGSACTD